MNQTYRNRKDSMTTKAQFETKHPFMKDIVSRSPNIATFRQQLAEAVGKDRSMVNQTAKDNLLRLIRYDGKTVYELSEGKQIKIETISKLWRFLKGDIPTDTLSPYFLTDISHQIERLHTPPPTPPSPQTVMQWMDRWPGGTDRDVISLRQKNKERIVNCIIAKIERRHSPRSRYIFPDGISLQQKRALVEEWWNDYHFHLAMAIRSPHELNLFMDETLSKETMELYHLAVRKGMPIFVTPYYLSLLNIGLNGYDDTAIRSYIFYSKDLVDTFGHIKAWEREDIIKGNEPNIAGWLLPEGHNIHRRYPDVAILIPDSMGRSCGGLCASCQRMYNFQRGVLNFNFDALKPTESWQKKLHRLMVYFEEDKQIRDILITGGDALMSQDSSLRNILEAVYKMALRKKKANEHLADGQKMAEIQRIRLGTRLPAYLPMRVTDSLISVLSAFREKGQQIGIKQFFIQTHYQTPLEVTPEAVDAIRRLQRAGWTVTNQLVYNIAASRRGHTVALRRLLNSLDVLCYYTFTVKGFNENHAIFTPNSRSIQEQQEEKVIGQLSHEEELQLVSLLQSSVSSEGIVSDFCKTHRRPFIASDRSVLNLPGIGKSMSFRMVGIMEDGRRILEFDHDPTRRHSPVIEEHPHVYICENKSIGEYLHQLTEWGEDAGCYETIWQYTEGQTERRFALYEYPEFPFRLTKAYNHIGKPRPHSHEA